MPFGKHKGELISKLPADYKAWLQAQDSTDQYLKIALGKD
jgi:exodeoxyribonuclease X